MKRTSRKSIIGGIVALALILTGTGYAYWTDTLNVTTKATTGEFDVTFVDLGLYAQYDNETKTNGWSIVDGVTRTGTDGFIPDEYFMRGASNYNIIAKAGTIDAYKAEAGKYNNIDFNAALVDKAPIGKDFKGGSSVTYGANTDGSDQILITVDNVYPGYAQAFRSDILNLGTLAAKLSDMKFSTAVMEGKTLHKDMLGIAVLVNREAYNPGEPDANTFRLCKEFANGDNFFTIGGVDFLRLSALEGMEAGAVREMLENNLLYAQPGSDNRLDIFLAIGMDPDADGVYTTGSTAAMKENDDKASQKNGAVISIDLLWDQFNAGTNAGNPNILEDQNAVGAQ